MDIDIVKKVQRIAGELDKLARFRCELAVCSTHRRVIDEAGKAGVLDVLDLEEFKKQLDVKAV